MSDERNPRQEGRLWSRDLWILWGAVVQSAFGDAFLAIGLMWLVLEMTGSALAAGTLLAVGAAPKVFGPFAGVVVDRKDKRALMIGSDVLRGALLLAVFALHWSGHLSPWMLFAVAFFEGGLTLVYGPSLKVLLPKLVPDDKLPAANSAFQAGQHSALIVGTAAAGLILSRTGAPLALLVDGATFLVGAGLLLLVRFPGVRKIPERMGWREILEDLKKGFGFLVGSREIVAMTLVIFTGNFLLGPINVVFPVFSREVLGQGVEGFGFLASAVAVGLLLGNVAVGVVGDRIAFRHSIFLGIAGMGVVFAALSFVGSLLPAILFSGLLGAAMPLVQIPVVTRLQRVVPETLQGKVFATISSVVALAVPIGSAVFGHAIETWSVPMLYRLSALLLVVTSVAWWLAAPTATADRETVDADRTSAQGARP